MQERISKSDKYVVVKTSDGAVIESQPTRAKAIRAANILWEHNMDNGGKEKYSVRYAAKPDCVHIMDNQGLCHICGMLLCEGTANDSGYPTNEP